MSVKEVVVPNIGDFQDVDVIEVHIAVGQTIQPEDPLITLESDKASMDLPAEESGVVKEIKMSVGDQVNIGDVIFLLDVDDSQSTTSSKESAPTKEEETQSAPSPAPAKEESTPQTSSPAPEPTTKPQTSDLAPAQIELPSFREVHASPGIRRYAREKHIDLTLIQGTGRKGRITREDVDEFIKPGGKKVAKKATKPIATGTGIPPIPAQDFTKFGPTEVMELGRIKKLTAQAMTRSWLNIPHVTHNDEADVTELEAFRKSLKKEAEKKGVRVSILAFVMKALIATLKEFPTFNASLSPDGETLILKQYYHIGIAVDTPNGLVVPSIKDVDQKSVYELSAELGEVSKKARENKLKLADIQGGTFTISSLGGIGGTTFSPIINAPEVAILGMTRSKMQPVWDGTEFTPRLMQPLSLSYDHRVIDGAEAARFCRHLTTMLSDLRRVLL
ncbi:MAG TPA: dihydrolipoyllysine-residue acetyltransferase [Myxococcales bacterium]|nr:dihydrolipoyllysine-residue acetyltransferase [Myxococcales bacterium]